MSHKKDCEAKWSHTIKTPKVTHPHIVAEVGPDESVQHHLLHCIAYLSDVILVLDGGHTCVFYTSSHGGWEFDTLPQEVLEIS